MQQLKLLGMAGAFEALLQLPVHQHPPADQLLAQLLDAEYEQRHHQKTKTAIRRARFRYQASLEEVNFLPARNLSQDQLELQQFTGGIFQAAILRGCFG